MAEIGIALGTITIAALLLGPDTARAQSFPTKPVRIVTAGIGGSSDVASRLIAQALTPQIGQQVLVDNRPSGVIPGDVVAKAAPDGHTVLFTSASLWIGALLENPPYDPVKDFAPISLTNTSPYVLLVHPSLPVRSVKELIALARARPGELNYASTGAVSASRLTAEMFKHMAHINIVGVPYKSISSATTDLLGGRVEILFYAAGGGVMHHVQSGKLRALGVTTSQPTPFFPGVPTVAATGLPGYESVTLFGMFAPAKTPAPIVARLNQEVVRALSRSDVKERFFDSGLEVVGSTPEAFASAMKADIAVLGKLIREGNLRVQ